MKEREIRAQYDEHSVTVYQAYNDTIAQSAVKHQRFLTPPFKKDRMTWIKPSFLWMMYRSGWASKANQERVLEIRIKRDGFEWALANSCLSHFESLLYSSYESWKAGLDICPVRIQWDPEKDIYLHNLAYRSIQIGLEGEAVERYVEDWIVSIEDITSFCINIHSLIRHKHVAEAKELLPQEEVYLLSDEIKEIIYHSL